MPQQKAAVAVVCSLFGFFGFSIFPVIMELSVECSYPVGEASSAGLVFVSGYKYVSTFSDVNLDVFLFLLLYPLFLQRLHETSASFLQAGAVVRLHPGTSGFDQTARRLSSVHLRGQRLQLER